MVSTRSTISIFDYVCLLILLHTIIASLTALVLECRTYSSSVILANS